MKEGPLFRNPVLRSRTFAGEFLFFAAMLALLFYKFHVLNVSMSSRHVLTAVTFFGSLGVLLCLMTPLLMLPGRSRGVAFVALDLLLSLLILTDVLYLRYYSDLFSLRNLGLSAQAGEVADSVLALTRFTDVFYFLDIPFFALAARYMTHAHAWPRLSWMRGLAICALFAAGTGGIAWKVSDYNRAVRGALASLWDRPAVAISTGTLIYHFADASNIAGEAIAKEAFAAEDEHKIATWLSERNGNRLPADEAVRGHALASGKNLIVIQVESLQAFAVGLRVGGVEVTPNINHLVRESLYFPRTFNQTAGGNSSDAEFMVNTSLFPTAKGVAYVRFAGNSFNSLGSLLKAQGYSTIALHGDRPGFWNRNHMYPTLGFDRYISKNEFAKGESIGLGLSDCCFFEQSLGYLTDLRDGGKPFYAFLVTLTSHYPFNFGALKEQVTDLPLGDLEDTLMGDYLRAIRYTDREIGNFIKGLAHENLLDNSVVVLYGDHPAIPRGDSQTLGALLGRDLSSTSAWRTMQSIPLLIRLPEKALAGTVDTPTGQMDVAPTVASLMGFSIPTAFGRNLMNPMENMTDDFVIFRNGTYVRGDTWVQPQNGQAFDLKSSKSVDYDKKFVAETEEVTRRLNFSDRILENNLVKRINRSNMVVTN